jgi:hypothetical protein
MPSFSVRFADRGITCLLTCTPGRCLKIGLVTASTNDFLFTEFLATDPEARVRFPALQKKSSGSGTGSTQPREYNCGAT